MGACAALLALLQGAAVLLCFQNALPRHTERLQGRQVFLAQAPILPVGDGMTLNQFRTGPFAIAGQFVALALPVFVKIAESIPQRR